MSWTKGTAPKASPTMRRMRTSPLKATVLGLVTSAMLAGCHLNTATERRPVSESPPVTRPAQMVFPAAVSANHRYLVDQNGAPYLLVGDAPQSLIGNLSEADADRYFADRQAHGINATWINLLCDGYTGCHSNGTTRDGIAPFTTAGDLSTPNPAYFQRADDMVNLAAKHGITVFLDPIETGGWLGILRRNGTAKATAYGQYVGNRYKSFPNILWQSGNDFQSWRSPRDDALVLAVANGIKAAGDTHLQTIELNFYRSVSTDAPNWASLVDLNAAYTYYPTYDDVLRGYNHTSTMPVFMVEAHYEGENIGGPVAEMGTPPVLRRQEYWTMLSGATGQLYGSRYWRFQKGWQTGIDSDGAAQLKIMADLFHSLPWYNLVPDQSHTLVTKGYGTFSSSSQVSANDYASAALTGDGSLGIVYLPTSRTITVDMSRLRGPAMAHWYDPTNGASTTITGSPFPNSGAHQFRPPATNSSGDHDWVLLLQN